MNKRAFTLVELLIVVVIIGILAGLVLSVIQPAVQQQRAREGVMRTQMSKVCGMAVACMSGQPSYNNMNCTTLGQLGLVGAQNASIIVLPPYNLSYTITTGGSSTTGTGTVIIGATLPSTTCNMTCTVSEDLSSNGTIVATGCRT